MESTYGENKNIFNFIKKIKVLTKDLNEAMLHFPKYISNLLVLKWGRLCSIGDIW